jgi:hypothetical protein
MNIFEQAVRQQLRFDFKGQSSIEQLYAMRKTQSLKDELISYEEDLQKQSESFGKNSRRASIEKTKAQKDVELRLSIISSLLDEIEQNEKDAAEKADKQAKRQELLALKAQKQSEQMNSLSLEEIEAQLKAL